jgi:hypothetical protein
MTCEACQKEIHAYPCACGYQPKEQKQKQQWLIQCCTTPGCEVSIRTKIDAPLAHPVCKWCEAGTAYNTRPHPAIHPGEGEPMSKEECGLDLFEAIGLQTAMREAFKTAKLYRDRDKPKAAEEAERAIVDLQKHLEAILKKNTIEPADLTRLLAIT